MIIETASTELCLRRCLTVLVFNRAFWCLFGCTFAYVAQMPFVFVSIGFFLLLVSLHWSVWLPVICLLFSPVCCLSLIRLSTCLHVSSNRSPICLVSDRLFHFLSRFVYLLVCVSPLIIYLSVVSSPVCSPVCRGFGCLLDCLSCLRPSTWPRDWLSVSPPNTRPSFYHVPSPSLQR